MVGGRVTMVEVEPPSGGAGPGDLGADDENITAGQDHASEEPEEGEQPASKSGRGKNASKRCPWNWRPCESVAVAYASLAASETHGEQESNELFKNCADEYIELTNKMAAEGSWPVNGDNDHPRLQQSQQWRAEGCDPACPGVLVNPGVPRGRAIWKHWLEIKRQINNEINVCLQDWVMATSAAAGKKVSLYSGTNWDEVVAEVRTAYWRSKTKPKGPKPPPAGWTTPAFEVWLRLGYPAMKEGKECHPSLQMEARSRTAGEDDMGAGRNFLRQQSKRVKRDRAASASGGSGSGTATAANGGGPTPAEAEYSPVTKAMLGQLQRVGDGMDAYNARQDIVTALQFTTDPEIKAALVAALVSRPGVASAVARTRTASPTSSTLQHAPVLDTPSTSGMPHTPHSSIATCPAAAYEEDEDI